MRYIALFVFSLAAALAGPVAAQDAPDRVGRLAYAQGAVSVYQDPDSGWEKAYVNTPITSENSIWTDRGARAEMRVGATALRLDGETQLDISRLDQGLVDATVTRGHVNARVRYKQRDDRISISTPQALFVLEGDGRYSVDVDPERDESRLSVLAGEASIETGRGRVRVAAGRSVVVYGGEAQYVTEAVNETAFDRWSLARDNEWRDTTSQRYVSTDMTGYEDLDRYGSWAQDDDYGAVWFPTRVASNWAPYRNGHWAHVRPWGWTWIDDEPWGYAPSHYGRWVQVRDRWGWAPGRRIDRPVWAPALVGWVGGSNWSVGIGSTSAPVVGWYPLAPWERYQPWYRANTNYASRVNVNVQDRAPRDRQGRGGDDWRRWNRDRGTTVVQRDAMIDRRPVQGAVVNVAPDVIRRQPIVAPAQVQQVLPQRNELARRRVEPRDVASPPPAPAASQAARGPQGAPGPAASAPAASARGESVRPDFSRRTQRPALAPAPANQPPAQAAQPNANPAARVEANPAARGDSNPAARGDPRAQQQQQQQERAAQQQRESQQREGQQREAQQREAQQRDAQQRDAQQRDAQQRQARDAQQQQERAARDAQAQQQRAAQQLQQQQERAAREAQQQAAQAQQQQERAAREAQQAQQNRAARGGQPAPQAQPQQQPQAQPAQAQPAPANPAARGNRPDRERDAKDQKEQKEQKDKDDKR